MSESNGNPVSLKDLVAEVLGQHQECPEHFLRDLESQLPHVRRFLAGGLRSGQVWPCGTIRLSRLADQLLAVCEINALEVEARYLDLTWSTLWERIENDLETGKTPWRPNWKRRQREERKLVS